MAIYGTPLTLGDGGGGKNETLPPLLDNFKANKDKAETVAFLNVPAGSTILLGKYKGKPIRWKVIDGMGGIVSRAREIGANYLRIYDRNLISPRAYYEGYNYQESLPNDGSREDFTKTTLCKWLNSPDKKSPYYGNESGFLYEWTAEERNVLINWWRNTGWAINVGITVEVPEGAHIGFPRPTDPNNTFWRGLNFRKKAATTVVYTYETLSSGTLSPKAPDQEAEYLVADSLSVEPEISIDSKTQFVFNGTDYVLESAMETQSIVISADKMPVSRANALAGAVWVYGEHEPKNVNDGTKINLTREEIVADSGTIEKSVSWDKKKEFHARQFTYNAKKQYQTMLEGAIAYLPIMPDGQELSQLPSKSKIKLGKWNNTVLKWIVCRGTSDNQVRLILDGSSYNVLGKKQFDAPEPSNSNSDRRSFGNNRYIWSNIHQWLNSNKAANQWYTSQHGADAPPDYANQNGFLNQWTEKEIKSLEFANWTVTKSSVDGSGSETFRSRVTLASTTEIGLESGTGGGKLDIMNSNGDRALGSFYWCRTPVPSNANSVRGVDSDGSLGYPVAFGEKGVRPLCKPIQTTLVSAQPDSDGCYTLV